MTEPRAVESWSLRGKVLKSLAVTAVTVALALSAVGVWFISEAAHREVDALLHEELDEVRVTFTLVKPSIASFEHVAEALHESHPSTNFAWRVWRPGGEELLGEFGDREVLQAGAPALTPLDQGVDAEHGYRWRSTRLKSGHVVGLILDKKPHFELVRRFGYVALIILLVGFYGIFLMGMSFAKRISKLLAGVAEEAREISGLSDEVQLTRSGLPEEISAVVDALDEMLRNARAEHRDSRLLIAGVAHELRSPLQNLIGEAEVALLSERSPQVYQEVLRSQLDELRDLGDAIQNLVALCSAKRSAAAEELESFDLAEELRLRLTRESKRAEREGLELSIETEGDAVLLGDREALMTGLRNIVSNAIDWTPRGGRVEVACVGERDRVVVTVCDTGPGIPADIIESLFEPFVRGSASGDRRIGYGLGLALARSAALSQGGSVEVVRTDRPGACFRVELPRRRPNGVHAG